MMMSIIFVPQLFVCSVVFCYRLARRPFFPLRLAGAVVLYGLCSILLCALVLPVGYDSPAYPVLQFLYFALVWACLLAGMTLCFRAGWKSILFAGLGAYATQHIGYCVSSFLRYLIAPGDNSLPVTLTFEISSTLAVCLAVWLIFVRRSTADIENREHTVRFLALAAGMLCSCILLSAYLNWFETLGSDMAVTRLIGRPYGLLCCLFILIVMFSIVREDKLQRDRALMDVLLHAEKEQHRLQKESVDIINMKCHDLKHQINALVKMDDSAARGEYVREIAKAVDIYDAGVSTGSDALDLVLTQKILLCRSSGIEFTYMTDGAALAFMSSSDILSLFGNVLDNAIEAVRGEPEGGRMISLRVSGESGAVYVHAENTFSGSVEFEGGLPQTTKADKNYHGFGVRSIRYIVRRYGGEVNMYTDGKKFNTDILFLQKQPE